MKSKLIALSVVLTLVSAATAPAPVKAFAPCAKPLCLLMAEQAYDLCLRGGGITETCDEEFQARVNGCLIFCV